MSSSEVLQGLCLGCKQFVSRQAGWLIINGVVSCAGLQAKGPKPFRWACLLIVWIFSVRSVRARGLKARSGHFISGLICAIDWECELS